MNDGPVTHEELAQRVAAGDRVAFAALVRAFGPQLAAIARAGGVAPGDVEDVVQETFVSAWRAATRYDSSRPFRIWLFQIALNKSRDWRRRRRVRQLFFTATSLEAPEAQAVEAKDAGPEAAAHDRHVERMLMAAIGDLPEDLQQPFFLVALAEFSYSEAGSVLGMSVKTIEGRVARARRRLQAALPQIGEST